MYCEDGPLITNVCHLLPWHVYINPPLLYNFFSLHDISNTVKHQSAARRQMRRKMGAKTNIAKWRNLHTLSKAVLANRNWSVRSCKTQKINPLIDPFSRKSRCCSISICENEPAISLGFKNGGNELNVVASGSFRTVIYGMELLFFPFLFFSFLLIIGKYSHKSGHVRQFCYRLVGIFEYIICGGGGTCLLRACWCSV